MFPRFNSTPAKRPPTSCIARDNHYALCGRGINMDYEHAFHDAAYAVRHYADSTVIRACDACVRTWRNENPSTESGSMATRGIKGL